MVVMAQEATSCPACGGKGERELPGIDDVETLPCPICQPWPHGFPGEKVGAHFIIEPAAAGVAAVWAGPAA